MSLSLNKLTWCCLLSNISYSVHQVIVHGLLHCKFCDKVFKSATEKKQHDTDKHNIFSCNQCKQNFSSHKLLIKHRAERHKLFACNFCDYNFTETDFQGHHIKTHRMMLESLPSLTPDIYYETEVDVIIPTDEKMKLKVTENISGRFAYSLFVFYH